MRLWGYHDYAPLSSFAVQGANRVQLCDPTDCSTPGSSVVCYLPEFLLTHVHHVRDAIQPAHPLAPISPHAFNLSQHQGLFQLSQLFTSGGQSIGASASASVLPVKHPGLMSFRMDLLDLLGV